MTKLKLCECGCKRKTLISTIHPGEFNRFIHGHCGKLQKGKTLEELYGKEKAIKIRNKMSKPKVKKKFWTKEKIILAYLNIIEKYGKVEKDEINYFHKKGLICGMSKIRYEFSSLDEFVKLSGVNFKIPKFKGHIGKNEKDILDIVEKIKGVKLKRQFQVGKFFIDGYDVKNNVAYEYDEYHHKNYQVEDYIREEKIKNKIGCEFIRIREWE